MRNIRWPESGDPLPTFAIVGSSGSGKTTLIERVLPFLRAYGYRVGVVKHAHEGFEIDQPGKDSHRVRRAGAAQVLVGSNRQWALIGDELPGTADPQLRALIARFPRAISIWCWPKDSRTKPSARSRSTGRRTAGRRAAGRRIPTSWPSRRTRISWSRRPWSGWTSTAPSRLRSSSPAALRPDASRPRCRSRAGRTTRRPAVARPITCHPAPSTTIRGAHRFRGAIC